MKKLILLICLFFIPSAGYSLNDTWNPIGKYKTGVETETGTYLEQDPWEPDRINIKSGLKTEGYIKRDTWEKTRFNVYDKNGKKTGIYLKRDTWEPERYNIKKDQTQNRR